MSDWKEIEPRTRTFRLGDEPELIHIIKTGYFDTYMIVYESGYEMIGDLKIMSKEQILAEYNIEIDNIELDTDPDAFNEFLRKSADSPVRIRKKVLELRRVLNAIKLS